MSYAEARSIDPDAIPVIDLAGLASDDDRALAEVADALVRAAEGTGFFYVRNHGIDRTIVDAMFATARAFFDLPLEEKRKVAVNSHHRGFIRIGEAKMYASAKVDLKESFVWGLDVEADDPDYLAGNRMIGPNRWPDALPGMRPQLVAYMDACNRLGIRLLRAFATSIGVERDYFVHRFDRPISRGSLIYYPPQDPDMGNDQFGVAPHTDYGCLTLLYQDDAGGLQVKGRDGDWIMAPPIPGTFVVNVGDLLARWTNDRFASTPHRVVNASGRTRYSVAVFVDPDHDTTIDPVVPAGEEAHYPPVTCADHILGRYNESFAYRKPD